MFSRNPERSPVPGTTPVPATEPAAGRPTPAAPPAVERPSGPPPRPEPTGGVAIVTGVRDVASTPGPALQAALAAGTVIARTDRFEGTIKATEAIRILGSVEGRIEAATLVVEEGAKVKAEIVVDEAVVAGEVTGTLTCRNRLEVRPSGRITGQVETVRLMLHEGASVDGEMRMMRAGDRSADDPVPAPPPAPPNPREGGVRRAPARAERPDPGLLGLEGDAGR